jgi:hypothetical protein
MRRTRRCLSADVPITHRPCVAEDAFEIAAERRDLLLGVLALDADELVLVEKAISAADLAET